MLVKDVIKLMKMLFFKYQNVIPNSHFIMELMELVLNSAVMKFQEELFLQILGIVMGTNLAPILANIQWPEMYKRFIEDGSGVIKSNKKEFSKWVF